MIYSMLKNNKFCNIYIVTRQSENCNYNRNFGLFQPDSEKIWAHVPSSKPSVLETVDFEFLDILTKPKACITSSTPSVFETVDFVFLDILTKPKAC